MRTAGQVRDYEAHRTLPASKTLLVSAASESPSVAAPDPGFCSARGAVLSREDEATADAAAGRDASRAAALSGADASCALELCKMNDVFCVEDAVIVS